MYERGVPGRALNLNSASYPDHGRYGDLSLQGKISTAEHGIEPGTSWLVVRRSDHQAMKLVAYIECRIIILGMLLLTTRERKVPCSEIMYVGVEVQLRSFLTSAVDGDGG
jgi:hypothetical protein